MKRVLIIITADISVHGRVLKEIQALNHEYEIDTIGTASSEIDGVSFHRLMTCDKLSLAEKAKTTFQIASGDYLGYLKKLNMEKRIKGIDDIARPDVIIAHNADGLYIANVLCKKKKWKIPLVLNMHEYLPDQTTSLKSKFLYLPLIWYFKNYGHKADVIYTVSDSIAREYEKFLGLKSDSVKVVYNAPFHQLYVKPKKTTEILRFVTHGLSAPERKLERMIEVMRLLPNDRYSLDMYLVDSDHKYFKKLQNLAQKAGNVTICKPVNYDEIVTTLNNYDVFFYTVFFRDFSNKNALPNKFFEAIQGRLAVLIGSSPEMKSLMEKYELGVCSERSDVNSIVETIKKLTPEEIDRYKQNSDKYAYEFSAESAMKSISHIIRDLIEEA